MGSIFHCIPQALNGKSRPAKKFDKVDEFKLISGQKERELMITCDNVVFLWRQHLKKRCLIICFRRAQKPQIKGKVANKALVERGLVKKYGKWTFYRRGPKGQMKGRWEKTNYTVRGEHELMSWWTAKSACFLIQQKVTTIYICVQFEPYQSGMRYYNTLQVFFCMMMTFLFRSSCLPKPHWQRADSCEPAEWILYRHHQGRNIQFKLKLVHSYVVLNLCSQIVVCSVGLLTTFVSLTVLSREDFRRNIFHQVTHKQYTVWGL